MKTNVNRNLHKILIFMLLLVMFQVTCAWCGNDQDEYIQWLEQNSMLYQAGILAKEVSATGKMWQYPYALPRPRDASALASVWFTAYPASIITNDGKSIIATLGDENLWRAFKEIGIEGIHMCPMQRSGGITGREYTPTVDGYFDRIGMDIDPTFGTNEEIPQLVKMAKKYGAIVIGDVVPGHTGKGADFRLAERNYKDYPGIYHMVNIAEKDWDILPPVPAGKDTVNLKVPVVEELKKRGYIVGQLTRTLIYEPGIKDSDWSATDIVKGVDGVNRRWVYLHYFKDGQPTLNWLDPSFAAERLLAGDIINSMDNYGMKMLRLDANGYLGIEVRPGSNKAWSEGHPLSVTANEITAMMARKLGGFTFQELNLTFEDLKNISATGPDLSYDFVTRPAYDHALATGDTEFLRLIFQLMRQYKIDSGALIHALQNHDELTLELVHFWTIHGDDKFQFRGESITGKELRKTIQKEMLDNLAGKEFPYNIGAWNGISSTTTSLCTAMLGIKNIYQMTEKEKKEVKKLHLLLVMYNAFQPGVFAISGWDIVGALTLPTEEIKDLLADGDTRWINRGAYDLMDINFKAVQSSFGIPKAVCIYGSLPQQMKNPDSFAMNLKKMLNVRKLYRINEAELIDVPKVKNKGLLVLVHKLPGGNDIEVTAINFGKTPVSETILLENKKKSNVTELLGNKNEGYVSKTGEFLLNLNEREGKVLLIK